MSWLNVVDLFQHTTKGANSSTVGVITDMLEGTSLNNRENDDAACWIEGMNVDINECDVKGKQPFLRKW